MTYEPTPEFAEIETIKRYQRLPEKNYKLKWLILIGIDALMVLSHITTAEQFMGFPINPVTLTTIDTTTFIQVGISLTIVLIGFLPYCLIRNGFKIIKGSLGGAASALQLLNPFNTEGRRFKKSRRKNQQKNTEHEQKQKELKKNARKLSPLLSFRESFIGKQFRGYAVLIHMIAFLELFMTSRVDNLLSSINPYSIQIILTVLVYAVLSREPTKTKNLAEKYLKEAFKYYCSPDHAQHLSPSEKELFDKNFKIDIQNSSTHHQGYFFFFFYYNQEYHYFVRVHVTDLMLGVSYTLVYTSDTLHKNWDISKGITRLTQNGVYI